MLGKIIGSAVIVALGLTGALAQAQQTTRVRGEITSVDGSTLLVKARNGDDLKIQLTDNARVMSLVKASMADIKPGSYIGVTGMPEKDGSQRAVAIHIFPEQMRGTGEGHRPWDLRPNSTMTNAAVDTSVSSVDGQVIMLKYKDGEQKVIVGPETPIVAYSPGDKSDIKSGAKIIIMGAQKKEDGSLTAAAINVGKDGLTPPM